ncbi:MAG: hypothetical protein ACI8PV_001465 [Dinoroseobacter sp.]|jgi:hypothetical protein
MSNCSNCDNLIAKQSKYCSQCGQSVASFEKPIRPVLTEMLHETLDTDGRMLLTIKTLLLKPGLLSLEYRNGKRTLYTPPLRMYLVISILFFLLISALDLSNYQQGENFSAEIEYYPKIMFALLPLLALLFQLLFRGTFYLSNLVFALHIHCIAYMIFAVMIPMEAYEKTYSLLIFLQFPFIIYLLVYIVLALKRYYAQSWGKVIAKFLALFFLYVNAMAVSFDYILPKII